MSESFADNLDFTFNAQVQGEETGAEKWNWAATVFGDPLAIAPRLQTKWAAQLADGNEASLYSDWQTRDTELGYRLLEPRIPQWKLAAHCYQIGLVKRQRDASLLRARLDAIEKINQAEPNPALRHPKDIIVAMERDIKEAGEEFQYLRDFQSRVQTLVNVIGLIGAPTGETVPGLCEQLFRLIGQAWKGQMKIRAFQQRFPQRRYHIGQQGGLLQLSLAGARGIAGANIIIDEVTANYLLHCLETIATLAVESAPLFNAGNSKQFLAEGWTPPFMLLRAIIELFHYCNFELPYRQAMIYLDRDNPQRLWIYQPNEESWQSTDKEAPGERLKRNAAEIASLLSSPPAFLSCTETADLSRYLRPAIAEGDVVNDSQYQPYYSAGLARLESDAHQQFFKFQSGYELSAQLLDQLIATQPHLARAFESSAGGPLLTLRAMARLEPAAFKISAGSLTDEDRFALLGRFWRLTAKNRPLALLGQDYAKAIYKGMAAAGEVAPERSSLLSVQLSSVFTQAVFGKDGKLADPIAALVLSDQVRLVELLNSSWALFTDCFAHLENIADAELTRLFSSVTLSPEHEELLAGGFNSRWLNATQSIWSLIRAAGPETWNFWTQLHSKKSLQSILSSQRSEQALNYLFQTAAGTVRLMLLIESSSPVIAERLSTSAEAASQRLIGVFAPRAIFPALLASFQYYFDPDTRYDSWLAFAINFHRHLRQIAHALEHSSEADAQLDLVKAAITKLEIQYPDISATAPVETIAPALTVSTARADIGSSRVLQTITENTAQDLEIICQQLLGGKSFSPEKLPQMLALARVIGMDDKFHLLARAAAPLQQGIDDSLRSTIFLAPSITNQVVGYLKQCWPDNQPSQLNEKTRAELNNYLAQTGRFLSQIQHLIGNRTFLRESARTALSQAVFAAESSRLSFYLYSFAGQTFCNVAAEIDEATALTNAQTDALATIDGQFENWQPEILLIGGGQLLAGGGKLTLTGAAELNPLFTEPEGKASARLLWYGAKIKFEMALQILRNELSGAKFTIEL